MFFTLEKFKITLEQIFLTVGQNNYGNKIPVQFDTLLDIIELDSFK